MNRLQKKCVIATTGFHLLLLLVLLFGSAFFNPQPKPDNTQVLDVIPANLVDALVSSGVRQAAPPPPAPAIVTPPQPAPPTPPPPAPKPVVTPQPTLPERLANIFKTEPVKPTPDLTPVEKPVKSQPHKIQPNLTPTVRTAPKNPTPDNSRQSPRLSQNDFQKLREKLSQTTEVTMPGVSSESYASYRDALATIYYNAWVTPNGAANDEADTIVKITVASDGTVINAHITTPSGDEKTDASVRRALDRVSSVPPLPDKAKSEQEFTIDFNLKTKRTLE